MKNSALQVEKVPENSPKEGGGYTKNARKSPKITLKIV
jgi:hypothetical protein